jgi:Fe-S oxidoreductase
MARPDDRPLKRLPTLAARKDALEKCVFCPKLCRSACPVSNATPRETLTPWGKMSMAYFAARGDVPLDASFARPAWACTGCYACRESCDHRNEVAPTLGDARSALVEAGVAPEAATRAIARFGEHVEATGRGARALMDRAHVKTHAREAVLVGCGYVRHAATEAGDAVDAAAALVRGPVSVMDGCCGLPLLLAGDAKGFARHAGAFARDVRRAERVLVADAGCALALRVRYPALGVKLDTQVELLVELAARELGSLHPVDGVKKDEPVRWHDPCQLGRGLGVYEAPRAVLTRALGRAPDEFDEQRDHAACSGAGGLLPLTMPETAEAIGAARAAAHAKRGGGRVVTGCASSLRALRKSTGGPVDDIVTWIARAAGGGRRAPG